MIAKKWIRTLRWQGIGVVLACASCAAQSSRGRLETQVLAADGQPVPAQVQLLDQDGQILETDHADAQGHFRATHLTYGRYAVEIIAPGFGAVVEHVEIDSPVPKKLLVRLKVAAVTATVRVDATAGLLDTEAARPATVIGRRELNAELPAQPGRGLLDAIADQPGWIFEANGVVHPRGSEYETQFVVNGVPRTENLSPSFGSPLPSNEVESALILTAGFPAEFGRSLGGVVDVTTGASAPQGWHGEMAGYGGSFSSAGGDARLTFATRRQQVLLAADAYGSDRYLDPPVLENYTNHATAQNIRLDEQVKLSARDSLELDLAHAQVGMDVPNERVQEQSGQLQTRRSRQESGSVTWQRSINPEMLLTLSGSGLDDEASLRSNGQSIPVAVNQQRGFRQAWIHLDLAGHHGHHDWKMGADAVLRHVHEQLAYQITDASYFDPGTVPRFHFAQMLWDSEPAAFVEDTIHAREWNVVVGLRYEDYSFVLHRQAWSPRVAASRYWPDLHLLLHASYDRIFQVPAIENLLLASSPQLDVVSSFVKRLPVEPSDANFYEIGFDQEIVGKIRLAGNVYWRRFRNYADDDTLLNTGVSFPIAIARARIHGEELSLLMPPWKGVSWRASYSNQNGTANGPVVGGLFLGSDGSSELAQTGSFPISQDQRNTGRGAVRWNAPRWGTLAAHVTYNSGLPVELDNDVDLGQLRQQYGAAVVEQVDFARQRVRPWTSLDVSAGGVLYRHDGQKLEAEVHVSNLLDRVHVINFASLFSGTSLAPPRSAEVRLRFSF